MNKKELMLRASRIELIALDNDGVLTDGKVYINDEGLESKAFFIRDGAAINLARRAGIKFAVITGLKTPVIEKRAQQLHIEEIHKGFLDKAEVMKDILKRHNLRPEQAAYMGDDLFDLPVLRMVGFSSAPADAASDVKREVNFVSAYDGGQGAVREMIEFILKAKGQWEALLKEFMGI